MRAIEMSQEIVSSMVSRFTPRPSLNKHRNTAAPNHHAHKTQRITAALVCTGRLGYGTGDMKVV